MGPACKKKADSTDIDSTKTDINGMEITKTEVVAEGKIAFVSDRDGNREIYIMNVDGSEQRRLTNNPENDDAPAFHQMELKLPLYQTVMGIVRFT